MRDRFSLEYNEAASTSEAAFILDTKSGLRVRIISFRTLKQLDAYQPGSSTMPVRNLPILLETLPNDLTERNVAGILNRMANWYYHVYLNPKPPAAGTPPASESAD